MLLFASIENGMVTACLSAVCPNIHVNFCTEDGSEYKEKTRTQVSPFIDDRRRLHFLLAPGISC